MLPSWLIEKLRREREEKEVAEERSRSLRIEPPPAPSEIEAPRDGSIDFGVDHVLTF